MKPEDFKSMGNDRIIVSTVGRHIFLHPSLSVLFTI